MMRITPIGASAVVLTLLTSSVLYLRSRTSTQSRPGVSPKPDGHDQPAKPKPNRTRSAAPSQPSTETSASSAPDMVYITERGTKYHREECRSLRGNGRSITVIEARNQYDPCRLCLPPA